ncbi:hypothetical protein NDU88_003149 [Pleurodeles waltl]|uniref:Uncharacterized protein n=1 Tax=Pleurodeles waltl TaxID=8319 RepID=A0AAV7SEV9_PLEWA|nr:hypothetical protein NDU88_003149 [Pleurodeles waltl]
MPAGVRRGGPVHADSRGGPGSGRRARRRYGGWHGGDVASRAPPGQDRREEARPLAASGPVPGAAVQVPAPVCAARRASCGPVGSALGALEEVPPLNHGTIETGKPTCPTPPTT